MQNTSELAHLLNHAFGINHLFETANRTHQNQRAYPPYNIIVDDEKDPSEYKLEIAVAGYSKDQLSVKVRKENGVMILVVEGVKSAPEKQEIYYHQGLAARSFKREFTMDVSISVETVTLVDGILTVILKKKREQPLEVKLSIS